MTNNSPLDVWRLPRERMLETQLKGRGIKDERILAAMGSIPRHIFVDKSLQSQAYADSPLPIGYGQTISQPYIVAYMTQTLELGPGHKILEIGSGCGYQTAILAHMGALVYAIENLPQLFEKGRKNLECLKLGEISLRLGDGTLGWPEEAPFQAILVAAYSSKLPRQLFAQLAPEGRLIIPLGTADSQNLVMFTKKKDGSLSQRILASCRFVPLISP